MKKRNSKVVQQLKAFSKKELAFYRKHSKASLYAVMLDKVNVAEANADSYHDKYKEIKYDIGVMAQDVRWSELAQKEAEDRVVGIQDELTMVKGKVLTLTANMNGMMVLVRALGAQDDKMVTMQLDIMPQVERLLEQVQKEAQNGSD